MKTVYFVRHAKSSWTDSSLKDIERPLGPRGLRDAPFMAKLMSAKGIKPDLIISSPANRALSTAKHFQREFEIADEKLLIKSEIYEAFPAQVINVVNHSDNDLNTLFVFGHNPAFTSIANLFSDDYIPNIPTCGIFKIDSLVDNWMLLNEGTGRLTEFHYPKQYFD